MKKRISIEGMSCQHCVKHVNDALSELSGVTGVNVNLEGKYADLEANEEVADKDINFAIEDAGYEVVKIEVL